MSKRTAIRIPDDLYRLLVERAVREHRTVSNLLIYLVNVALDCERRNVAVSVARPIDDPSSAAT